MRCHMVRSAMWFYIYIRVDKRTKEAKKKKIWYSEERSDEEDEMMENDRERVREKDRTI